jgi:threonylcarbamoyladenosine tRNA methylthiotransferase MtaB
MTFGVDKMGEACLPNGNSEKANKGSKVCLLTLGCKVNQTESEALAQLLVGEGYTIVQETEDPDIIIINTCTVTGTGSSKSRKLIRKIAKEHPDGLLAVMGCYSQVKPAEVAELAGVDLILGTQDRLSILDYLAKLTGPEDGLKRQGKKSAPVQSVQVFVSDPVYEELPLLQSESRTRAMLKIQDGCSQFCTYCIVPYARGPSRSRDPEKVLAETERLLAAGYKEIVLTGIHIGAYGRDLKNGIDLAGLMQRIVQVPGLIRLRLGSIEPVEFTPELLDLAASREAVCPHFHIPLQSGSNRILQRMKRPYLTEDYARLLKRIREKLPEAAVAADIMTGFPGETEEDHRTTLQFIEDCNFASVHVFPYSPRPGTPAAAMPDQIPGNIKTTRVREIIGLGLKSRQKYVERFVGKPLEVLLEKVEADGSAHGHTRNYLELKLPQELNPGCWQAGELVVCPFRKEYLFS